MVSGLIKMISIIAKTGWNSFQRLHIVVQAKERELQISVPWVNLIWSKWRHIFSLFWRNLGLLHRKLLATTYLRDKQEKYPGYASRNGFLKIICLMCGGRTEWHYYNWRNDSSHCYGRIPVVRIEILKLHQVQIN